MASIQRVVNIGVKVLSGSRRLIALSTHQASRRDAGDPSLLAGLDGLAGGEAGSLSSRLEWRRRGGVIRSLFSCRVALPAPPALE